MSAFEFVFPVTHGGEQVGEIEGRCTVERDGSLSISLYVVCTKYSVTVPCTGSLRSEVESYIVNRCAGDLDEARENTRRDVIAHDRAVAA